MLYCSKHTILILKTSISGNRKQALKKKVICSKNSRKDDPENHREVSKFIALAFMPSEKIPEFFNELKADALKRETKKEEWRDFV